MTTTKVHATNPTPIPRSLRRSRRVRQLPERILAARELLAPLPTAMVITDSSGSCVYANRSAEQLFGVSSAHLRGVGWMQLFQPEDLEAIVASWTRAATATEEVIVQARLRPVIAADVRADPAARQAHVERSCTVRARRLNGDANDPIGVVGIFEEVSIAGVTSATKAPELSAATLHELEQQRRSLIDAERSLRHEAELLARMKDDFLCTVSHELRTPLHAILGWAQLLARQYADPATVERSVEVIQRNGHALKRLLEDLLDMKAALSGSLYLCVEQFDAGDAVQAVVEALRYATQQKKIALDLSGVAEAGLIRADLMRFKKLFWNILSNAVKFTPVDGVVTVSLRREDTFLEVLVRDTGCGIAPEQIGRIFEPFGQSDSSSTREHGGLGCGLALTRHLVTLHGGAVTAHSAGLGQGATIRVLLPV